MNFIRHKDWLGSSRLATTWAHAVYSKEAYAPFGETYNEAGTADRSFTGQDQDVVTGSGGTGVYDFLFRKYDPSAGRWLSPDPAGWGAVDLTNPQSLNRSIYLMNQAMSGVDPTGLCPYWSEWTDTYTGVGGTTTHNWYLSDDGYPCYYPPSGGGLGVSQGNPPPGSPFGNSNSGSSGAGGGGGVVAPNNALIPLNCAGGRTVRYANNWRIQANAQGVITAVGIPLTGPSGYASGPLSVAPNTILGIGLGNNGALSVAVNNPIYYSTGLFGAYISSATYNNGAFTQVNGTRAILGVPWSSSQTASSYLLNQFNANSSLSNIAGDLQSAAQLGQQLLGCQVTN